MSALPDVGTRVRITAAWLATLVARGCSAAATRYQGVGTVHEAERNERYGWTSVLIEFDSGACGYFAVETLEVST